jgi:hypothetical protein
MLPLRPGAAFGAFDGGEVTAAAAARVNRVGEVMILATRQAFDEVAAALKETGFEEDGDLLVAENPPQPNPSFSVVADAGDGVIVLAASAGAAEDALTDGELGEAAALLKSVSGAARSASTRTRSDCLLGIAAGQELEPPEAQIAMRVRGEPSTGSLAVPFDAGSPLPPNGELMDLVSGLRYGQPTRTADGVVVDVRYNRRAAPPQDAFAAGPVAIPLTGAVSALYRCP